jgi:signal transduction histidine kinase
MAIADRTLRRLAWAVFSLEVLGFTANVILVVTNNGRADFVFSGLLLAFPIVGVVVLSRRPRTTLGWLMLSMGLVAALPLEGYAAYAFGHGLPGAAVAVAIMSPGWVPFIGLSGFLLLLFPDGHVPSPRWRWFAWLCGLGLVALFVVILLSPGTMEDSAYPNLQNPLGVAFIGRLGGWTYAPLIFAPLIVVGGAAGVITRLRRSGDPVERRQLRWLAWAAGLIALIYVLAMVTSTLFVAEDTSWNGVLGSIAAMSFILIPISIGIAIMRYRLYEIDVVIRKTVIFAVLAAFIAAVYVGLVAAIGIFVGTRNQGVSAVAAALAAAIVSLAFQPVSRWGRRLADRLVFGERANPYEVLARFGDQLADSYAADDVLVRIARVLGEGLGAARARVWLLVDGGLRSVAIWPPGAPADEPDDLTVEVRHQGEALGALSVALPANDPLDPAKEKLVRDLAAQAGLVLRNVRLTEQLRARLEDLQAAQKRLVAAQDQERRRLERNIHDGAQQQLVALAVQARLTRRLLDRDPERAAAVLEQIAADTQTALDDLRDLAHGIYPPLLADQGLVVALESQARRSTVPVTVSAGDLGRFAVEIEAAVYFSCLEGLQNVAKYAAASSATVRLEASNGTLCFTIHDDGRGFDSDATSYGSGLQGIADRLGALDGSLTVASAVGRGTTLVGSLPAEREPVRVGRDAVLGAGGD